MPRKNSIFGLCLRLKVASLAPYNLTPPLVLAPARNLKCNIITNKISQVKRKKFRLQESAYDLRKDPDMLALDAYVQSDVKLKLQVRSNEPKRTRKNRLKPNFTKRLHRLTIH